MSKIEKVRINLSTQNSSIKTYNQKINSHSFILTPRFMPFLSQLISDVNWNCSKKTLHIKISETTKFDAFNWFGGINKRLADLQKSSFVDLEQDSLLLVLMDENTKESVNIKFYGLSLLEHNCYLSHTSSSNEHLVHSVVIQYSDCETVAIGDDEDLDLKIMTPEMKNELVDKEWQESDLGNDVAVS